MNRDSFNKDQYIQYKLDEYHVEIPDFPMKSNKWIRLINFLASPARNPFDPLISTSGGILLLKVAPLLGSIVMALLQVYLFL
ncbi:hypothetical protein FZW96_13200 [Bacillus sp. BGMRC 2118]|nr:hypothetical protein FZW96_13200 [Bacillus sp. BGMRC 2118]